MKQEQPVQSLAERHERIAAQLLAGLLANPELVNHRMVSKYSNKQAIERLEVLAFDMAFRLITRTGERYPITLAKDRLQATDHPDEECVASKRRPRQVLGE